MAEVDAFVERFTAAWAEPELERFAGLFHPDIVLEQPVLPRTVGKEAAVAGFKRLLASFPGLHGEVLGWSGGADSLYINLRLRTGGSRPLEWDLVDRIRLQDGLIRERISYFNGMALLVGTLVRPGLWAAMARGTLGR